MLDLTKPMQTRDGRKVRYLGTLNNKSTAYPLIFAVEDENGDESSEIHTLDGKFYANEEEDSADIINVPKEEVGYAAIIHAPGGDWFGPTYIALEHAKETCVPVHAEGIIGYVKLTTHNGKPVRIEFVEE